MNSASATADAKCRPDKQQVLLELISQPALDAYRQAAFQAIEACRERDGALHWRPEVVYALAR